jgi:hypothetical protein
LLFPFYSYAAKISLSISGKIEDHSAMLYFPDGRELPISIDASGKGITNRQKERLSFFS